MANDGVDANGTDWSKARFSVDNAARIHLSSRGVYIWPGSGEPPPLAEGFVRMLDDVEIVDASLTAEGLETTFRVRAWHDEPRTTDNRVTFDYQRPDGVREQTAMFDTLDDAAQSAWQRVVRGFREEGSMGIVRIVDADGTVYDDDDLESLRLQRERREQQDVRGTP